MQLPEKPLTVPEVEAAAGELGLSVDDLTVDLINSAYRYYVRRAHPDFYGMTSGNAAARIGRLQGARETLLRWLKEKPDLGCRICKGTGFVSAGAFQTRPCPKCG